MSKSEGKIRILILDSGRGYGGPGVFLCYLLKCLDKKRFQPLVGFYLHHCAPETSALRRIGIPVFFLSSNTRLADYLQVMFVSRKPNWRWWHLCKELLRAVLRLVLIEIPQLWELLKVLKREKIELIVLNNDVHFHLVGALAARITGVPCICRKAGGIEEGKRLKKVLTPWINLFVAVSGATARDQLANNPSTKKVVTIYEGIDLQMFVPRSSCQQVRRELGIPADVKVVGYISRLVEGKGHKEFVEAATSIMTRCKNVVFLIVGDDKTDQEGRLMRNLQAMAKNFGVDDKLIFAGWRTDIPSVLSALDIFVHCPTTFIEGLGLAHLEAMAMGKPTVVSDNGGLSDAAVNGVTGFIVPPGDVEKLSTAILKLLEDDELALRLGRNARQRVEELFDAAKNTQKLEALFEEHALKRQLAVNAISSDHLGEEGRTLRGTA
jgi:glycosyltransferase involved in cell wall biosynthesis